MKVLIAMDSFKGSLTAFEACTAFQRGMKKVFPLSEITKLPMADGGEGTVQSLVDATGGEIFSEQVTGPLGEEVEAFYGVLGDKRTAVIEMAAAGGLGGGMIAFLGAELKPGIDMVIEKSKLRETVQGANLVVTGEGKIDYQTIYGKTPMEKGSKRVWDTRHRRSRLCRRRS